MICTGREVSFLAPPPKKRLHSFPISVSTQGGKVSKFYVSEDLNKWNCRYLKGLAILKRHENKVGLDEIFQSHYYYYDSFVCLFCFVSQPISSLGFASRSKNSSKNSQMIMVRTNTPWIPSVLMKVF